MTRRAVAWSILVALGFIAIVAIVVGLIFAPQVMVIVFVALAIIGVEMGLIYLIIWAIGELNHG